ncbi:hypothetical protein GPECTOR_3g295 [Gonium pectorale]|uniref:RNA-binding S4 domain-containing protein n=1 Tax=Gonium pectorale TaxID=33097 RepID=A0A150GZA9_GONPE|nr:hypothetical protein GPECTOR_3g295 [Gonium pectorale]|eukprot:KXZ55145.1 hypothetical protein GPECTOR_3g295 [Gonium pectorale]
MLSPARPSVLEQHVQRSNTTRSTVVVSAAVGDGPSSSGRSSDTRPRLAKVLAGCGVASRRACEGLIAEGRVRVNGRVVSEQGTTVDPSRDKVEVLRPQPEQGAQAAAASGKGRGPQQRQRDGKPGPEAAAAGASSTAAKDVWRVVPVTAFQDPEGLYYFAVNKPKGYICTSADTESRKLAVDLLSPWLDQWKRDNKGKKRLPPRLFTVGRLDVASSGLIFITNDGSWANRVIHPSSGVTKEYVVGLEQPAARSQLEKLAAGTEVAGSFVTPLEVEVLGDPTRLRIVVEEGKKHEVRELVAAADLTLRSLRRVRIGGFRLPADLGIGGYKQLKPHELRLVTDLTAQEAASVSGQTRQAAQRAAQQQRAAAAKAKLPAALRSLPAPVLERIQRVKEER